MHTFHIDCFRHFEFLPLIMWVKFGCRFFVSQIQKLKLHTTLKVLLNKIVKKIESTGVALLRPKNIIKINKTVTLYFLFVGNILLPKFLFLQIFAHIFVLLIYFLTNFWMKGNVCEGGSFIIHIVNILLLKSVFWDMYTWMNI